MYMELRGILTMTTKTFIGESLRSDIESKTPHDDSAREVSCRFPNVLLKS